MEEEHVTLYSPVTKAESFMCVEKELPCYMGIDSASFEILMIDIRHKLSQCLLHISQFHQEGFHGLNNVE